MVQPSHTQKATQEPLVSIADVQGLQDTRRIDINRVGIKGIRHPVRVKDRTGGRATYHRQLQYVCVLAA